MFSQLLSLLLLGFTFEVAYSSSAFVYSPSGLHQLPTSLIRRHLPSSTHPSHNLSSYIYEHSFSTNRILTKSKTLIISTLAPEKIETEPARRYIVNGIPLAQPHTKGPVIHKGEKYIFTFDPVSGSLLGGWGPGLILKPLDIRTHPTIYVNIHYEEHKLTGNSIQTLPVSNRQKNDLDPDLGHFKPGWRSERDIFMDVGIAFDASFCANFGGDPARTTLEAHSTAVMAHEMSLTRIISLRVGDVVGFCKFNTPQKQNTTITGSLTTNSTTTQTTSSTIETAPVVEDIFGPPSAEEVETCKKYSNLCSMSFLRLNKFRKAWLQYLNDSYSDAAYLLTSSSIVKEGDVVGSAWVASACSEFGFGYVLGNHHVVLAHELGHTLGAPHSSSGLMRSYLSLKKDSRYLDRSLHSINTFISKIAGQSCLVGRQQGNQKQPRLQGFTELVKHYPNRGIIEASDIAVGKVRTHGEALLAMIHVSTWKKNGVDQVAAGIKVTTLTRSTGRGFPFTYNYSNNAEYVRRSWGIDFNAGMGVATASLNNDLSDDIICVSVRKNIKKFEYIFGYNVEHGEGKIVTGGWSRSRIIWKNINGDVKAIGAVAGNMRGYGQNDLIISYVTHRSYMNKSIVSANYIIGYNLNGKSGRANWGRPVEIPVSNFLSLPTSIDDIGDISVAIWENPVEGSNAVLPTSSLLFSLTVRNPTTLLWDTIVCVSKHAQNFKPWNSKSPETTCYKPPLLAATKANRLTGGIALTSLLASSAPVTTSILFQNRRFDSVSSQWLDVGDGLLTNQKKADPGDTKQLALTMGEDIIPKDVCSQCYNRKHVTYCEGRVRSCFSSRQFGKLDKVTASEVRMITPLNQNVKPEKEGIFCAGFHSIFVSEQQEKDSGNTRCDWDSKRISIISEGVRVLFLEEVERQAKISPDKSDDNASFTATALIEEDPIPEDLNYILDGRFGVDHIPGAARVTVFSQKDVKHILLQQALNRFKRYLRKLDFNTYFEVDKRKSFVTPVGKRKYIVTLKLKESFQLEYLKDIRDGRFYEGQR